MTPGILADALEREHHEIDRGIGAFLADPRQTAALRRALAALRRHIYLEEEFLFPPLYDAGEVPTIVLMIREHGAIWRTMDAIAASLAAGAEPRTAELCHELLGRLERHNAKEEAVIYPEADTVLRARGLPRDGARPRGVGLPERHPAGRPAPGSLVTRRARGPTAAGCGEADRVGPAHGG
jgi:hypothetical protein